MSSPRRRQQPSEERRVRILVRAKPRASRSRVLRAEGLNVDVALAAPPVDGAANAELLALLSESLSVSRTALQLQLGEASRHKVVAVEGLSPEDVAQRLRHAAGPARKRSS